MYYYFIIIVVLLFGYFYLKKNKNEIFISKELNLTKLSTNFNKPWSITFIGKYYLITERSGNLILLDSEKLEKKKSLKHNLEYEYNKQGGLLDILYNPNDNYVYISYAQSYSDKKSGTSVARAPININELNKVTELKFKNIFESNYKIKDEYHYGSRLTIRNQDLFVSLGERNQGMISQDKTKHPGSIVRINLNNMESKIITHGVRNPQGLFYSKLYDKIYMTNHGAKGGDWFGEVEEDANYGWKIIGWGGTEYTGLPIGPKWKEGFKKPKYYWTPSIAVSNCIIIEDKLWGDDWFECAIVASLKDQSLRKLNFKDKSEDKVEEEILLKNKIGRIRDIKINNNTIFLLTDDGHLYSLKKNNNN